MFVFRECANIIIQETLQFFIIIHQSPVRKLASSAYFLIKYELRTTLKSLVISKIFTLTIYVHKCSLNLIVISEDQTVKLSMICTFIHLCKRLLYKLFSHSTNSNRMHLLCAICNTNKSIFSYFSIKGMHFIHLSEYVYTFFLSRKMPHENIFIIIESTYVLRHSMMIIRNVLKMLCYKKSRFYSALR